MKKEDVILPEIHGTGNLSAAVKTSRKVTAVKLLVAGAIGLLLYWAHVAFVPVALALLLALVLIRPGRSLARLAGAAQHQRRGAHDCHPGIFAALVDFVSVPRSSGSPRPRTRSGSSREKFGRWNRSSIASRLAEFRRQHRQLRHPAPQAAVAAPEESGSVMLLDANARRRAEQRDRDHPYAVLAGRRAAHAGTMTSAFATT